MVDGSRYVTEALVAKAKAAAFAGGKASMRAGLEAVAGDIAAAEQERIAQTVERSKGSTYVRTMDYCIRFDDGDEDDQPPNCGQDPCPGHLDGHSAIWGPETYAKVIRGEQP